jgi:hypothetical protein
MTVAHGGVDSYKEKVSRAVVSGGVSVRRLKQVRVCLARVYWPRAVAWLDT